MVLAFYKGECCCGKSKKLQLVKNAYGNDNAFNIDQNISDMLAIHEEFKTKFTGSSSSDSVVNHYGGGGGGEQFDIRYPITEIDVARHSTIVGRLVDTMMVPYSMKDDNIYGINVKEAELHITNVLNLLYTKYGEATTDVKST